MRKRHNMLKRPSALALLLTTVGLAAPLALNVGCAVLDDEARGADAGAAQDSGIIDEGGADSGPPLAFSDGGADAGAPSPARQGEGDDSDAAFAGVTDTLSCRDGIDNDGDTFFDCADPFCQRNVPSCCVGQVGDVCCAPGDPSAVPLEGCEGDLTACAGSEAFHFFGAADPDVRVRTDEAFATLIITEDRSDTGFVLDRVLDPRAGDITVEASIAVPAESVPEVINALGLGFISADGSLDDLVRVAPSVGLMLSRNRGEIIVLAGGSPVFARPLGGVVDYIECRVTLGPDGRARVQATSEGGSILDETLTVGGGGSVRAVFWGRGTNPLGDLPIRARSIAVSQLACDMPAALTRAAETAVPAMTAPPEEWADREIGAASVLRLADGSTRMAIEIDGDGIHLGTGQTGSLAFDVVSTPEVSETDADWGNRGISHPALFLGSGGVELWFTAESDDGSVSIGSIAENSEGRFLAASAIQRLTLTAAPDLTSLDHPHPFMVGGQLMLLVHEEYDDGDEAIGVWELGATPVRRGEVAQRAPDDVFAFDRDELGGASVIYEGGVYRVYYAGRRGLRWSIGVAVSDDGLTWYPEPAPVLTRTESGPDNLGVRAPSAIVTEDGVLLYYLGTDGNRNRIGVAQSPSPRLTPPG